MSARGDYMRAYRQSATSYRERQADLTKARYAALTRLARRHADEYAELYRAELAARGVAEPKHRARS
jgi:hypothetical protein